MRVPSPESRRRIIRGTAAVTTLMLGWQFAASVLVKNPLFLAGPSDVGRAGWIDLQSGVLWTNVRISCLEFAYGATAAIAVGVVLGLIVGYSDRASDYADPIISASYSAPLIALAPLFILWFGLGIASKVAVIFTVVLFPILISVSGAVRTTNRTLLEVAAAFGATRRQLFRKFLIPAALPATMTGIRIAVGRGLAAVVVAELFGARAGVGYAIAQASYTFDTARIFLGVAVLMGLGWTLMELVRVAERMVAPWAFASEDER